MNNRDGTLRAIREDNYHYTFIRGQEAVKIAECACFTDGKETPSALEFDWGYCNSNQQLLAMQEGQGAEGSAEIYNWLDPEKARKHLRICAVMGDKAERIDQWRAERNADGTIVIRSPENGNVLVLRLDTEKEEAVLLQDGKELPLF